MIMKKDAFRNQDFSKPCHWKKGMEKRWEERGTMSGGRNLQLKIWHHAD
jgi:hypothetical protein